MSDLADIQAKIAGTLGLDEGGEAAVANLYGITFGYDKAAADAMASTALANTKIFCNPYTTPLKILRATFNPTGGGLTAHAADYATVSLLTDDGLGGTPVAALSIITTVLSSGTWIQNVSVPFANPAAAALAVPAGGNVWLAIAKAGSGVIVPIGKITLIFQKL